jgi:hypothetical protein
VPNFGRVWLARLACGGETTRLPQAARLKPPFTASPATISTTCTLTSATCFSTVVHILLYYYYSGRGPLDHSFGRRMRDGSFDVSTVDTITDGKGWY